MYSHSPIPPPSPSLPSTFPFNTPTYETKGLESLTVLLHNLKSKYRNTSGKDDLHTKSTRPPSHHATHPRYNSQTPSFYNFVDDRGQDSDEDGEGGDEDDGGKGAGEAQSPRTKARAGEEKRARASAGRAPGEKEGGRWWCPRGRGGKEGRRTTAAKASREQRFRAKPGTHTIPLPHSCLRRVTNTTCISI